MLCLAKKLALLPLLALVVPLAACGSSDNSSGGSDHETLTVLAASSLTKTFTELGRKFESAHPGTTVKLSFGGSSDLVEQITSGAPADVFASADAKNMDKLGGDARTGATSPPTCSRSRCRRATRPRSPASPTWPSPV